MVIRVILILFGFMLFTAAKADDLLPENPPVQIFQQSNSLNNPAIFQNTTSVAQNTPPGATPISGSQVPNTDYDLNSTNVTGGTAGAANEVPTSAAISVQNSVAATQGVINNRINDLSANLDAVNQQTLLLQQRINRRLELLEAKSSRYSKAINQLSERVQNLELQVNDLNIQSSKWVTSQTSSVAVTKTKRDTSATVNDDIKHARNFIVKNWYYILVFIGLALLLIIFLMMLFYDGNKKKSAKSKTKQFEKKTPNLGSKPTSKHVDAEQEYDYLNSVEGIAAKLDLARAYIAMSDFKSARETLQQVIRQGNNEQKIQAYELLDSLNNQKPLT